MEQPVYHCINMNFTQIDAGDKKPKADIPTQVIIWMPAIVDVFGVIRV